MLAHHLDCTCRKNKGSNCDGPMRLPRLYLGALMEQKKRNTRTCKLMVKNLFDDRSEQRRHLRVVVFMTAKFV